jgi:hypothetical protein
LASGFRFNANFAYLREANPEIRPR